MKQKTLKIIYWVVVVLFSLFMLFSAYGGFFPNEQGKAIMASLGYPMYVLTILSIAKILGVIAILQNKFKTIKEWAYAGFTFDILGAALSFVFAGMGVATGLFTCVFLIPLFIAYFLDKKVNK